jgi:hypothetical protein
VKLAGVEYVTVLLALAVGVTVTAVDAVPDTPALLVALTVQL